MKTLPLSMDLLNVIVLIQAKKNLAIDESILMLIQDWQSATREYFFALPNHLVDGNGLARNEYCFNALLGFTVTQEMIGTQPEHLSSFPFTY
jgi:hypothetical protein